MKNVMRERWSDMLPEYNFSKGVRGKYAKRYAEREQCDRALAGCCEDIQDFGVCE
jgi:hypothetical protein